MSIIRHKPRVRPRPACDFLDGSWARCGIRTAPRPVASWPRARRAPAPTEGESRRHDEGNPQVSRGRTVRSHARPRRCGGGGAQSLSTPTFTNNSNPDELVAGTPTTPSRERETAGTFDSPSGAFRSHSTALVTVDSDGAAASSSVEALSADYTIDFTVTAPGAYVLTVDTHLSGDMNLVNDGPSGASADISGVTGSFTGGTLSTGSLDLDDPGSASGNSGGSIGIDQSGSATIFGVSNGAVVPHSLRVVVIDTATTTANGDEGAIRLGATSHIVTETAGGYPGSPARVQADDGPFVTVTLTSLCGNGTIDIGPSYTEECDDGPANGTLASCCATTCTFKPNGTGCDDNDACTNPDT